ncbi:unnamed protein product [Clonostachys rhizophaga]|uniref:Uncharacterized protein n=1 Tax=Clonostachys rhizophaga TaxID=160324 RepID=A0A9N9YIG8_9HYPO|nr:unnamed protein product [Clonostachys rhizophaga]
MRSSWIVALTCLIAPLVHAAPSTPPELEVRACIPFRAANAAIMCLASGILVDTKRAVFVHKQ